MRTKRHSISLSVPCHEPAAALESTTFVYLSSVLLLLPVDGQTRAAHEASAAFPKAASKHGGRRLQPSVTARGNLAASAACTRPQRERASAHCELRRAPYCQGHRLLCQPRSSIRRWRRCRNPAHRAATDGAAAGRRRLVQRMCSTRTVTRTAARPKGPTASPRREGRAPRRPGRPLGCAVRAYFSGISISPSSMAARTSRGCLPSTVQPTE